MRLQRDSDSVLHARHTHLSTRIAYGAYFLLCSLTQLELVYSTADRQLPRIHHAGIHHSQHDVQRTAIAVKIVARYQKPHGSLLVMIIEALGTA